MKERTAAHFGKILAVLTVLAVCLIFGNKALADDTPTPTPIRDYVNEEQYKTGYYRGYVASESATVRKGPGTKAYPELKLEDGTVVKLKKGDEVFVWGETKDVDLDVWYHITGKFKDEDYEGYIYIKRVNRENTQIQFTPAPTPTPTPTPVPVISEPAEVPEDPDITEPTPEQKQEVELPKNLDDAKEDRDNNKPLKTILVICLIFIVLISAYFLYQRVQEKKLEEEMERYSKQRPALERLDGEDEESFKEVKKQYYASMNIGRDGRKESAKKPVSHIDELDDELNDDDLKLNVSKNSDTGDLYEIDSLSDDDVKIINDFHANSDIFDDEDKVSDSSDDDLSDEDLKYFEKMKGNVEAPSASAIAAAGSAESILDESPIVNSCFEDDAPTPEERLRMKIDSLRAGEVFVHKLYGEGEVIDNSDSEVIQVRFGRDLRFLKKEKLARKDLVVM